MKLHQEKLTPPVVGDLQMPRRLWWMCLVAAEATGADPALLAAVMRFEGDFRTGESPGGTYVFPMGLHKCFRGKYPIDDVFGNVLTAARRLAQFDDDREALRGYNTDRSSAFGRYCRSVLGATRRLKTNYENFSNSWAYRSAVDHAKRGLAELELTAAAYARRRN